MKSFVKLLTLLLCLTVIFAFAACSPNVNTSATPSPSGETEQEDLELQYLKSGDVFRLYHWWLQSGQEEQEFSDDSIVSRYRTETLQTLKDEYGVTVRFIAWTGSYWDEVRASAYSGEPIADGMHGGSVANAIDHYWYLEMPGSCLEPICTGYDWL